jgi:hypothetical protein
MMAEQVKIIPNKLKYIAINLFCVTHLLAIFWWTLPHSFSGLAAENPVHSHEAKLLKAMSLDNQPRLYSFFQNYIDLTGSQQYWDFFAPQSPRYHQYLSVCDSIETVQALGKIACKGQPGFSNLDVHLEEGSSAFRLFGSDRSRFYRLTENLAKLEDPGLLKAFTKYYRSNRPSNNNLEQSAYLVLHLFELHPELNDLPKSGYRMDEVLWVLP